MGTYGNKSRNYEIKSNSYAKLRNVEEALRKKRYNPTVGNNVIFVTSHNSVESDTIEKICKEYNVSYSI